MNQNYEEYLNNIKRRIERYKSISERKQKINEELIDLSKQLTQIKKDINSLEQEQGSIYSEVKRTELEELRKQEQDYLELINEYAAEYSSIVSNGSIDSSIDYDKLEESYDILKEFDEVSKKIKSIEKKSKKMAGKSNEYIDYVELMSADGKKKRIHKSLKEEYENLVQRKRELRKIEEQAYINVQQNTKSEEVKQTANEEVIYHTDGNLRRLGDDSERIEDVKPTTDEELLEYYNDAMYRMKHSIIKKKVPVKIGKSV